MELVNQQETLTQAEIGWMAGIIDGDGSLSMNVRRKNWNGWKGVGVDLHVWVVNTDATIIEKFQSILNKMGIRGYINERQPSSGEFQYKNGKSLLACGLSSMEKIRTLLETIKDSLTGDKKSRANLILEFINRRKVMGKKYKHYSKDDWKIVEDFYRISNGAAWEKIKGSSETIREALA